MADWVENFAEEMDSYQGLDNLTGRDEWKLFFRAIVPTNLVDQYLQFPESGAFVFMGESGMGKTTLALALGAEFAKAGYLTLHLPAFVLLGNEDKETCNNIETCLQEADEEVGKIGYNGSYIFIEDIETLCESRIVVWNLVNCIRHLGQLEHPMILVCTTEEKELPPKLMQNVILCHVELPTEQERRAFFEQNVVKNLGNLLSPRLSVTRFCELTEGFNFAQLNRLTLFLKARIKNYAGFGERGIEKMRNGNICIREQEVEWMVKMIRAVQPTTLLSEDENAVNTANSGTGIGEQLLNLLQTTAKLESEKDVKAVEEPVKLVQEKKPIVSFSDRFGSDDDL